MAIYLGENKVTPVVAGGGSSVSYTPILTSGTEIGTLTIDNNPQTIYGPTFSDAVLTPVIIEMTSAGASGVTISTNRAIRSGNVVTVMAEITLSAAVTDFTPILTGLPGAGMNIAHTWTEVNWGTSYSRPLRCRVTTTGEVEIRYGAATTYRLNTTYICYADNAVSDADENSY